ncbi:hypothetical protein JB92DRAFT_3268592 [Gautieria morchelliformis]|nr:hypothetical protein JB92DRAFT_3268592 [Gautieria morchelliformis]
MQAVMGLGSIDLGLGSDWNDVGSVAQHITNQSTSSKPESCTTFSFESPSDYSATVSLSNIIPDTSVSAPTPDTILHLYKLIIAQAADLACATSELVCKRHWILRYVPECFFVMDAACVHCGACHTLRGGARVACGISQRDAHPEAVWDLHWQLQHASVAVPQQQPAAAPAAISQASHMPRSRLPSPTCQMLKCSGISIEIQSWQDSASIRYVRGNHGAAARAAQGRSDIYRVSVPIELVSKRGFVSRVGLSIEIDGIDICNMMLIDLACPVHNIILK